MFTIMIREVLYLALQSQTTEYSVLHSKHAVSDLCFPIKRFTNKPAESAAVATVDHLSSKRTNTVKLLCFISQEFPDI